MTYYERLIHDLQDKPELLRYILQEYIAMYTHFIEVFDTNGVLDLEEDEEVWYLSFESLKNKCKLHLKFVQEELDKLANNKGKQM